MCDKFPSIEQFRHFVKELARLRQHATRAPPTHYHLTGTVKLHGTHADVIATRADGSDGWQFTYQSRNRVLTSQSDNLGFAAFMDNIPATDRAELFDSVRLAYDTSVGGTEPVTRIHLAGEWCGSGIQHGVALDRLPRMFVLYGVKVNDVWQPFTHYGHVSLEPAHRVYNVLRVPAYRVVVEWDAIDEALPRLQALTAAVEAECPFALSVGGVSGVGEGIVWVCDELCGDSSGWFKTKGDKHAVSKVPDLLRASAAAADTKAKLQHAEPFVDAAVTEQRLRQGLEYLREMQLPLTRASIGEFIRWVWADVQKEEADSIAELGIDRAALGRAVTKRALEWFQRALHEPSPADNIAAAETAGPKGGVRLTTAMAGR